MTYYIDKEPMFVVNGVCVEEEGSADEALGKEVGSESREPFESVEASAGFEHKEGNRLLDEETNDNGPPLDSGPVLRSRPETKLKHDETHDGNGAIAIVGSLRWYKFESRISKWG
jgi:hypothetical protein